jgi:hypothetical protein
MNARLAVERASYEAQRAERRRGSAHMITESPSQLSDLLIFLALISPDIG